MTYSFEEMRQQEREDAIRLDEIMAAWFEVQPATESQDKGGVDRWFVHRKSGHRISVQYKCDRKAESSGNAFIELVSVNGRPPTPGWAWNPKAELLLYFLPLSRQVYFVSPTKLYEYTMFWCTKNGQKLTPNEGYETIGVTIPLKTLEKTCCVGVLNKAGEQRSMWDD